MLFLLGFLSPYIGILIIAIGMKLGGKKLDSIGKSLKKLYCTVLFTLSIFGASLIASFISMISGELILGAIFSTVVLLICWCSVELFYRAYIDREELLKESDKNFCNLCGMVIVVAIGVYLFLAKNYRNYLEIGSIAISIWLGAYIPIVKIFSGEKFKNLIAETLSSFECKDNLVKTVSIMTGLIIFYLNMNSSGSIAINAAIDEFKKGLFWGCILILGVSIGKITYKKSAKKMETTEGDKDENKCQSQQDRRPE